ncbi:MAG: DEAD/DEAH box helicase family protein [Chloroflexi bacterium]|nr:DEAD/DEAH box helicase family protein [Chloroflexota bacterium]
MTSIVALDLETTGLNPEGDAITEIGAVRFNSKRIEGEWHSLINPGRRIPPNITQLTGITDAMVRDAPTIHAVLADLADFVGDSPVLGHNVRFDLGFLNRYGILQANDPLDTYEMAAVLLPTAGRYKLGALAQALGVILPNAHRALDDARATHAIYLRLYEEALNLPLDLLAEIVRLADDVPNWMGYGLFFEALRTRSRETVSSRRTRKGFLEPLFARPPRAAPPLIPAAKPSPLDVEDVAAILEYGGEFSHHFPNYEQRPEQVEMLRSVTRAISEGQHLMVEAGTGVGKSFAYLIPAALWAIQNGLRVVISTNTINLQDQLINKDIPDLQAALGLELRATVLKGRNNYLCPHRLEIFLRRGPETPDEIRVLAKVLVWLQGSTSGDRGELNLNGPAETEVWSRLSAADEGCTAENCLKHTGGACPFYQARQSAHSAHLIIVNHALLLADIATGNRVLPDYDYLIVDEAHHLEEATTNALSFRATHFDFIRVLRELGNANSGILGRLLSLLHDSVSPSTYATVDHLVERATDNTFQLENLTRNFFNTIDQFLFDQRDGRPVGPYAQQVRILPSTRVQPAWLDVEIAWEDTQGIIKALSKSLEQLSQAIVDLTDNGFDEMDILEDIYSRLTNVYRRVGEMFENIEALVFDPQSDRIYWAEIRPDRRGLTLQAAPLHIGPLMEKHLWHEKQSVILTSATLTTAGEFDYLRSRLFAEDAYQLALGSPFDFENSTLLYIPNNIPEPGDYHGHQRAIDNSLIQLCRATGGRTLALFTSYAQLKKTSHAIGPALAEHGIVVYEQGGGASPHSLLESFKNAEQAVLLGTRAFWEGVDVPGEALSVLVIVKLPFDVPSDPIIAARSETFEDPFHQYALPEAILRFRQGFGRLIRTQSDRGVVVVLDKRVLTKRYGPAFTGSLPQCTQRVGALQDLPREAATWLNL